MVDVGVIIPIFSLSGYDISQKAMQILFNRFAKRRQYMALDDFCSCLSRVKIMSGREGGREN